MFKFQRTYSIEVQDIDGVTVEIQYPLTLEFSMSRRVLASVNNGMFRIHNLGQITRRRIYKDLYAKNVYRSIVVRAGYGEKAPIIFKGNLLQAQSFRQEGATSVITELHGQDGGYGFSNSFSSFTITSGQTQVDLIKRLGSDLKNIDLGYVSDFDGVFNRGIAVMGNTVDLLKTYTGGQFFVDNEKYYALKPNDAIQGAIYLITSDTGLLGAPYRSETWLMAEILFEPRLQPGQAVEIISDDNPNYNGIYKVFSVEHTGIISGSVNGKCITRVGMAYNQELRQILTGAL